MYCDVINQLQIVGNYLQFEVDFYYLDALKINNSQGGDSRNIS